MFTRLSEKELQKTTLSRRQKKSQSLYGVVHLFCVSVGCRRRTMATRPGPNRVDGAQAEAATGAATGAANEGYFEEVGDGRRQRSRMLERA